MSHQQTAVLCPIGPLGRFGYQYNRLHTIGSYSAFADNVYLNSSKRNDRHHDEIVNAFDNVTIISYERSCFDTDTDGNGRFTIEQFDRSNNVAMQETI